MEAQQSYPQFGYQQKLIHILIHIFFSIFTKIVDFKGFLTFLFLWITY